MRVVRKLPKLKKREPDSHKGTYGRILVIAGSRMMNGAAYLCCQGAMRAGAGLVVLATPAYSAAVLASRFICGIIRPLPETKIGSLSEQGREAILQLVKDADVVAIGPGISRDPETKRLIVTLLQEIDRKIVLDADGLNAVCDDLYAIEHHREPLIVTPHPREMARLAHLPSALDVQRERIKVSMQFAQDYGVIVVLKGHETIVTDGKSLFVNPSGNPGMATGGTGDVLTGVIAALLGQGLDAFDAAVLGVYVQGLAGDIAARKLGQISMIATDLLDTLPEAFLHLEATNYRYPSTNDKSQPGGKKEGG